MSTRLLLVNANEAGRSLVDWLCRRLSLDREPAQRLIQGRRIRVAGTICTDPTRRLKVGQRIEVPTQGKRSPRTNSDTQQQEQVSPRPRLRFLDEAIIVVEKPAGLTTMRHAEDVAAFGTRAKKYLPRTLADLLPDLVAGQTGKRAGEIRAVHRLDRDTSGLVVFARTREAERHLGQQFRAHTIDRLYLALVRGQATPGRIESWLIEDRGDGRRGSSGKQGEGQRAVTQVAVREPLGDFTLVECRLETGRTHQVRIHLGEAGTPLCGERIYDRPLHGKPYPDGSNSPRIALHAAVLGFDHPVSGERVRWESSLPKDLSEVLGRLRKKS